MISLAEKYGAIHGRPLDEEYLAELVAEAERGYDVDKILASRKGRPPLGVGPSVVVPVRLEPVLAAALDERVQQTNSTRSVVVRAALAAYLDAA
ncbi:MAG: ribbon-helix-helix protein, CopG family [Propionibacteriaceae bacterium]|jgi:hypothetical protein|nr:ribbon-helix-helix protein, CopG family [Propionibacteriaceae bacterium]